MIDEDRYMSFLERNKLNQAQFLLLYLLYKKRYDLIERYKKMFPTPDNSAIGSISFDDLLNRKFITEVNNKGVTPDSAAAYELTDKFTNIFIDKFECAKELWELYPSFVLSDGKRFPLTLCDEDKFREDYAKKINFSREEHDEVIKDLKYAKDNNLIKGKIDTFVASRHWLAIRKERLMTITDGEQGRKRENF